MKWYIEIQVNGSHVGMPVNQWCKILTEKGTVGWSASRSATQRRFGSSIRTRSSGSG
jgi:hypothetical protein